jgi:hypothetical protein
MYTKTCSKCGLEKEASEFRVFRDKRDGKEYIRGDCKDCISKYNELYRSGGRAPREELVTTDGRKCTGCGEIKPHDQFWLKQSFCKSCQRAKHREWKKGPGKELLRDYNRDYMRERRAGEPERQRTKNERQRQWDVILAVYGDACACCGETIRKFLTVDHVNGGGTAERKKLGHGNFITWLSRQPKLDDYQILCFNCNSGRARNGGICPHKELGA